MGGEICNGYKLCRDENVCFDVLMCFDVFVCDDDDVCVVRVVILWPDCDGKPRSCSLGLIS